MAAHIRCLKTSLRHPYLSIPQTSLAICGQMKRIFFAIFMTLIVVKGWCMKNKNLDII